MRSPIEPAHKGRAQRLVEIAERLGVVRRLRGLHDRRSPALTILAYHRVMPTDALESYPFDQELISATPGQFDSQMRYLREHLRPIALNDVITHVEHGTPLPPDSVAVTFDDGFADTYRYAFPVLQRYEIPATVFVSTGYVESGEPFWFELASYLVYRLPPQSLELQDGTCLPTGDSWTARTASLRRVHSILKDLPNAARVQLIDDWKHRYANELAHGASLHSRPITWPQIIEMAASGVAFGSHTVSHPNLTRLTDEDLHRELTDSKLALESKLQKPIDTIAYPIGTPSAFNSRVISAAREHSFKIGLTYVSGANVIPIDNPLELHRHGVGLGMSPGYFRALTSLPSWLD
jgi:peptidoglycan/xylan/chitin deacetylase (PgdA/CDA1 family)